MVLRRDSDGVLAVGQPAHAWLCGQFARAWGNERFGAVDPLDDVALGAEQHDLGWAQWDLAPQLNPETGLPVAFNESDLITSTELWRQGPPRLVSQSRYAALLAVMHGRRLFERVDLSGRPSEQVQAVSTLLAESAQRERELTAALQDDPELAPLATVEAIVRNSKLVWAWDTLSLALLLDWAPHTLRAVPSAGGGAVDVELRAVAERERRVTLSLSPWPFTESAGIIVRTEGRRLRGSCASVRELHAALRDAPWETIRFGLVPASPQP
jgi:hypothetical protein